MVKQAFGTQRNPTSLKSFIARQLYKNLLKNKNDVAKLQNGTSFIGKFKSKNDIINKITDLTERVEREEKEIDCADVLTKITFLYL